MQLGIRLGINRRSGGGRFVPLFQQVMNLRTSTGRTETATPFVPTSGNLPAGMSWSTAADLGDRPQITVTGYTGNMINWDADGIDFVIRSAVGTVSQCNLGAFRVDTDEGGSVALMEDCTIDAGGWAGRKWTAALWGVPAVTRRCMIFGAYGDGVNFMGRGDFLFERNYLRGAGNNLKNEPAPWSAATAYEWGDAVTDGAGGTTYYAKIANTNQPLSSGTHWTRFEPHADAMITKGSEDGAGIVRENLVVWSRDEDGSWGFGPVIGQGANNIWRFDPGNSNNQNSDGGRRFNLTVQDNIMFKDGLANNFAVDVVHRGYPGNEGLITFIGNWITENNKGRYWTGTTAADNMAGNIDYYTRQVIPTPTTRGAPNYNGTRPQIRASSGALPLLEISRFGDPGSALNTVTAQWFRNGVAISGATALSYQTVSADMGTTVTLQITGANTFGSAVSVASLGYAVQSPFIVFTADPVLSGIPQVGQTLTWTTGTHSETPASTSSTVFADDVAIAGVATSATSYTLTEAEAGKVIRVAVTVTASGGSVATASSNETDPVEQVAEYFIIALAGQSGEKYTYTGEATSTTFNNTSQYRPALAEGNWGRVVEAISESASIPTIENNGLIDRPITTTHFQTKSNDYLINRGVVALAQLTKHLTGKTPIIVVMAVGGTTIGQLMNDGESERFYEPFKGTLDYVRATYGEIDIYSHFWHGSEVPNSNYFVNRSPQFFMQLSDGTPFVPGTNAPDGTRVDHSIFDANAALGEVGLGTIPRRAGTLVSITALSNAVHDLETRTALAALLNSTQMSGMGMAAPAWAPHGGHTTGASKFGQALTGMATRLEALMQVAGIGNRRPAIASIAAAVGGTHADVTITGIPAGHKLTTLRKRYNDAGGDLAFPARVSPQPSEVDWFGFFIARNGTAINNRTPLTAVGSAGALNTQASFSLEDDGSVSGTAVLRITPEVAFASGDQLTYRQTGNGSNYDYSLADSVNCPWADYLHIENPALWDSNAMAPQVGPAVVPLEGPFTLSVTTPPAAIGDPVLLATYTPSASGSQFESGSFTVPSGNGVLLILAEYNSSITTDEVVAHSTIGAAGRPQSDGRSLTLLNALNTKSQNAAVLAYGFENPGAGVYTWQFGVGATNIRHMRTQVVWVSGAVFPAAQAVGQGVGGSSTALNFTNSPTAETALSLYVAGGYNAGSAWARTTGDAAQLDEGAGGGGGSSATTQIRGAVYWDKHNSLSSQAVSLTRSANTRRVGLYLELVGA